MEAIAAGATGYLEKETGVEQLLSAVRNVVEGELCLPAEIVRRMFDAMRGRGKTEVSDIAGLPYRAGSRP